MTVWCQTPIRLLVSDTERWAGQFVLELHSATSSTYAQGIVIERVLSNSCI
jgi:hypothetical protein